jgi:hypothetical protein
LIRLASEIVFIILEIRPMSLNKWNGLVAFILRIIKKSRRSRCPLSFVLIVLCEPAA